MVSALFVGRFQPFHNGHLDAIEQCLAQEEKIIIGIGSALEEYQSKNPFTASERYQMIDITLGQIPQYAHRYVIIPIPNINRYAAWPTHVNSLVPPFNAVYTGSDLTAALFKQYSAHPVCYLKKNHDVRASTIRKRIISDEAWESLVPLAVSELIKKYGGVERIKMIHASR